MMSTLRRIIVLLACFCELNSASKPIVEIEGGKILGRDHGHYLSFESIPYAEPPIGEKRFEAPQPFSKKWTDIRDATVAPVKCMQWDQYLFKADLLDGEEDCLTINVYTPSLTGNHKYPVLVLIHGGAFMFGAAASNGEDYIMKYQNTVVVKMNYRLGPLGFLSTEDEVISGNFGLKDQLLALEWTKTNVAAFNGNPENITILGFSSGGAAVHWQMLNKNLERIANTAISFSGTAFCPWAITRNPLKRTKALAEYLKCPTDSSSAMKTCLQQKEAADIVRAVGIFQNFGYNPFTVFGPVIESAAVKNAFLSEEPEEIMKSGKSAEIPWLASFSKDDGGYNAAELMQKDANGIELIEVLNDRWNEIAPVNLFFQDVAKSEAHSNDLRLKYMGNERFSAENYQQLQKMYTDVLFAEGVEKAVKLRKMYTKSPTFVYVYDNPAAFGIGQIISHREDIDFGTVHGDDFFLIFKSSGKNIEMISENAQDKSRKFIKMLEEFSTSGNLQFGECKFVENNSSTKGFMLMHITKNSCDTVNVVRLTDWSVEEMKV